MTTFGKDGQIRSMYIPRGYVARRDPQGRPIGIKPVWWRYRIAGWWYRVKRWFR